MPASEDAMELQRKLQEPFPLKDIEWRVSRAGTTTNKGVWCKVLAYITARAIESRLDEVFGPGGWAITEPRQLQHEGKCAIAVGISACINGVWVTKWDVSELTDSSDHIPAFKGGFSGAIKRAGAQWGIGRYLYHLEEEFADVRDTDPGVPGWTWAKHAGTTYFWKAPRLPGWALPNDDRSKVTKAELRALKRKWQEKRAPEEKSRAALADGFDRFVFSVVGSFPSDDPEMWSNEVLLKCLKELEKRSSSDSSGTVPFD